MSDNLNQAELEDSIKAYEFITSVVDAASDFKSPMEIKRRMNAIHDLFQQRPLPENLARLTIEGGARNDIWYKKLQNGLSHVRLSLPAAHYHLSNAKRYESKVMELAISLLPTYRVVKAQSISSPVFVLDYEYQAFLFALRRSLEHFAVSVGAYFKHDVRRIRKLWDAIGSAEPADVRMRVGNRIMRGFDELIDDVLPPKDKKRSVRDRLAHEEYVFAGHLNVWVNPGKETVISYYNDDEHFIKVDARTSKFKEITLGRCKETLTGSDGEPITVFRLTPALQDQLDRVQGLIFDVYAELELSKEV